MSIPFNLTAKVNVQLVGAKKAADSLKAQFKGIKADIAVNIDSKAVSNINNLNKALAKTEAHLKNIQTSAAAAAKSLEKISTAMSKSATNATKNAKSTAKVNTVLAKTARGAAEASAEVEEFGRVSGLAIRRFAGFTIATGVIFGFINAVRTGISEAIKFEREVVKLAQITKTSVQGINPLSKEVTNLAKTWGVASGELVLAARTLKQAGFEVNQTRIALSALAKADLAPTFNNITQTTEGSIAALRQFKLQASDLESVLGSVNAVAAKFAVESEDIISAVRRAGGVFAAASEGARDLSGELVSQQQKFRQFISLFTSVRATTRESGESIATGLRTIFTRITRRTTRDALRELGVELETTEGKFVGSYEAIRRLNAALSNIDPSDLRFFQISEQIAGFRQIGKVIPLIKRFGDAQKALGVAEEGVGSLTEDAVTAQQSLAVQIAKTRENFLALIRDITKTDTFKFLAKSVLLFADTLVALGDSMKAILPAFAAFAGIKAVGVLRNFLRGFRRGVSSVGGAAGVGEKVGGVGGSTEKNTAATKKNSEILDKASKGEKVSSKALQEALKLNTKALNELRVAIKDLAAKIGAGKTKLATGGTVKKFKRGGLIPGFGDGDTVPFMGQGGEFVVNRRGVQRAGLGNLIRLNGGSKKPLSLEDIPLPTKNTAAKVLGMSPSAIGALSKPERDALKEKARLKIFQDKQKAGVSEAERIGGLKRFPKSGLTGVAAIFAEAGNKAGAISPETKEIEVLRELRRFGFISESDKSVSMPLHRAFLDKERGDQVERDIQLLLKKSVANVASILGKPIDPTHPSLDKIISAEGVNLQDAGGKLFEAGVKAGLGLDIPNSTIDFPGAKNVAALRSLYPDIPGSVEAADAKLRANTYAYTTARAEYARYLGQRKQGKKAQGKASGGETRLASVALTPGEDVFYPDKVSKVGIGSLRKANMTGDRSGLNGISPDFTVPGKGSTDSYYTSIPEGSFVIRKRFSGGYAGGGAVGMAKGGKKPFRKDIPYIDFEINKAKIQKELEGLADKLGLSMTEAIVGGLGEVAEQNVIKRAEATRFKRRGRLKRKRKKQREGRIKFAEENPDFEYFIPAADTFEKEVADRKKYEDKKLAGYSPEVRKKIEEARGREQIEVTRKGLGKAGGRIGDVARKAYEVALKKGATATEAVAVAQKAMKTTIEQQALAQKKLAEAQKQAARAVQDYGKGSIEAKIAQDAMTEAQKKLSRLQSRLGEGPEPRGFGKKIKKGAKKLSGKFQKAMDSPGTTGLLFAIPALASQIEDKGISSGITGALGGLYTGAQVGGPLGAIAGAVLGGGSAAISGAQEQRLEKAQNKITESAGKVDEAFEKLNANLRDTAALKAFNAALKESTEAALSLQTVFAREEEFGGSLGGTFAALYGGDKAAATETGLLASMKREFQKTFGGITDDLGGWAHTLAGFSPVTWGITVADRFGAFGLGKEGRNQALMEEREAKAARNKRRNQEIFQALQPGAQSASKLLQAKLQEALESQGTDLKTFDVRGKGGARFNAFINSEVEKFTANSEQAVQALAGIDPKRFAEIEPKLNSIRGRLSEAVDEFGEFSPEAKKIEKEQVALLQKTGKAYLQEEYRKRAEIAVTQAKIESQIRALDAVAEAVARIGSAAERVAEDFSIAFEDIDTISTVNKGGSVGFGTIRNPFEDIANTTKEELDAGIKALVAASGGRLGAAAQQAVVGAGQSKIIRDNFLDVVKDVLTDPATKNVGQQTAIVKAIQQDYRLRGLNRGTAGRLTEQVRGLFNNRQGKGFTSLSEAATTIGDFTDSLTKVSDVGTESLAKAFKTLAESSSKLVDGFNQASEYISQGNEKFDRAFKLRGERALEISNLQGGKTDVGAVAKLADDYVKRLTVRAGIGGPGGTTNIGAIQGGIEKLKAQIVIDQKLRKELGVKNGTQFNALTQRIEDNTQKLKDANQALDTLASATEKLSAIQNKLAELQQKREAGRNFLELLSKARFDPKARIDLNKQIYDLTRFTQGKSAGAEGGLDLLRQIGAAQGKEDEINTYIARQQFASIGGASLPPELRKLLLESGATTARGKSTAEQRLLSQYKDASEEQIKAIEAQGKLAYDQRDKMIAHLSSIATEMNQSLGGILRHGRAGGGWINGPYRGNRDTEIRKLVPGEFVVRRSVAKRFGPQLEAVNAGVPIEAAFAGGGYLSADLRRKNVNILAARKGLARRQRLAQRYGADRFVRGKLFNQMVGLAGQKLHERPGEISAQQTTGLNRLVSLPDGSRVTVKSVLEKFNMGWNIPINTLHAALSRAGPFPGKRAILRDIASRRGQRSFYNKRDVRGVGNDVWRNTGFASFNSGGIVAGVTPGEFVVNRNAVSGNVGFLNSLNRNGIPGFQGGGAVGTGGGFNFGQLASAMGQFVGGVGALVPALSGFAQFATQLVKASSDLEKVNIPSTIQLEVAPIQVNVVINGAEALAQMQEPIARMVGSKINDALTKQINPITGETNETFTQV